MLNMEKTAPEIYEKYKKKERGALSLHVKTKYHAMLEFVGAEKNWKISVRFLTF